MINSWSVRSTLADGVRIFSKDDTDIVYSVDLIMDVVIVLKLTYQSEQNNYIRSAMDPDVRVDLIGYYGPDKFIQDVLKYGKEMCELESIYDLNELNELNFSNLITKVYRAVMKRTEQINNRTEKLVENKEDELSECNIWE